MKKAVHSFHPAIIWSFGCMPSHVSLLVILSIWEIITRPGAPPLIQAKTLNVLPAHFTLHTIDYFGSSLPNA